MFNIRYILFCIYISCQIGLSSKLNIGTTTGCTLVPYKNKDSQRNEILKKLEPLYGKRYSFASNDSVYDMIFCGSDAKSNATITRKSNTQGTINVLALRSRTTLVAKAENSFLLKFDGNKNDSSVLPNCRQVSSILFVTCDSSASAEGSFVYMSTDNTYCTFTFELKTSAICPHQKMGGWTIFFLIAFLFMLIYIVIGFFYLRCVVGARGLEQIPNRTMWLSVGNTIANFVDALCRCERYCGNSEGSVYSDYSPIGGATGGSSSQVNQDTGLLNP